MSPRKLSAEPTAPTGIELAGGKSPSGLMAFVTEEPDGLFYVWTRDPGREPSWTYAFKERGDAFEQLQTTLGEPGADDFAAT